MKKILYFLAFLPLVMSLSSCNTSNLNVNVDYNKFNQKIDLEEGLTHLETTSDVLLNAKNYRSLSVVDDEFALSVVDATNTMTIDMSSKGSVLNEYDLKDDLSGNVHSKISDFSMHFKMNEEIDFSDGFSNMETYVKDNNLYLNLSNEDVQKSFIDMLSELYGDETISLFFESLFDSTDGKFYLPCDMLSSTVDIPVTTISVVPVDQIITEIITLINEVPSIQNIISVYSDGSSYLFKVNFDVNSISNLIIELINQLNGPILSEEEIEEIKTALTNFVNIDIAELKFIIDKNGYLTNSDLDLKMYFDIDYSQFDPSMTDKINFSIVSKSSQAYEYGNVVVEFPNDLDKYYDLSYFLGLSTPTIQSM